MGFLNEIKKALFGAKAVTKSAAKRAAEKGKEVGDEILDKGSEYYKKAKGKAEELGEGLMDKAGEMMEKAKDKGEKMWEKAEEQAEKLVNDIWDDVEQKETPVVNTGFKSEGPVKSGETEDIPFEEISEDSNVSKKPKGKSKLQELGEELAEKGGAIAENVGKKVIETSDKVNEKLWDSAEKIGGKIMDTGGKAFEKAKDFTSKLMDEADDAARKDREMREARGEDMDSIIDKAKKMADKIEEKAQDKDRQFTDTVKEMKDSSLLDGKDSFFERAQRFAEGDYHNKGNKPTISEDPSYTPKKIEGRVAGFEDLDGDGDEIIDDAIIDDSDDDK